MSELLKDSKDSFEVNLFPLKSVVVFPETRLPLNIFEDRYKEMIHDCLDNGRLLAMAPSELLGSNPHLTVGFGEVKMLSRRKDGTMVVVLESQGRARIEKIVQKEPYMKALVTELNRDTDLSAQGNLGLSRIKIFLNSVLERKLSSVDQAFWDDIAEFQDQLSGARLVDVAVEVLSPSVEQKQMILDLGDLEAQVAVLDGLIQGGGPLRGQIPAQS